MESDLVVGGLGVPFAGVATLKQISIVQLFFLNRKPMAVSGLDGDASFAVFDYLTCDRAFEETMLQAI
jgi:hypothetical protein